MRAAVATTVPCTPVICPRRKLHPRSARRSQFSSNDSSVLRESHGLRKKFVAQTTTEESLAAETDTDSTDGFNWFKHWWPVQLIYNLDTDRPNRIQLIGEYFVAWKGQSGDWVVMRDMCPHRLAPLSEGRIEDDGTLMCSYHGWRFDETGKCVKIPQADDEKSHEAACKSPRSCAMTYPCKVAGGILWIWPDHSRARFLDASVTSLGLPDEYADCLQQRMEEGYTFDFSAIIPYGYEVLMENLVDPSHFPFAHHGSTAPVTRADGKPITMRPVDTSDSGSIAAVTYDRPDGKTVLLEIKNRSTVLSITSDPASEASPFILALMATPVESMRTRILLLSIPSGELSKKKKGPSFFSNIVKGFSPLFHLTTMGILDGDSVFLHGQTYYLRRMASNTSSSVRYFTPAASDLAVVQFRKWFDRIGDGGPFGHLEEDRKDLLPRIQLLDRFQYHVSECKVCQKALQTVNKAIDVCKFMSLSCLVATGAFLFHGMQHGVLVKWRIAVAAVAFALFFAVQRFLEEKLIPQFYFVDYVHAEKN